MLEIIIIIGITALAFFIIPYRYMLMLGSLGILFSTISICICLGSEGVSSTIATIILIALVLIVIMIRFSRFGC